MEELCDQLRGLHAVDEYPVDVWKLAKGMGIRVVEREWDGLPHAICVEACRLIILNARRSEQSRRFDLAHELGHFVLDQRSYHQDSENRFASTLLMPARVFKLEMIAALGQHARVGKVFGLNTTVVIRRAKELSWRG